MMTEYETVALTQATCDVFENGVIEKMRDPKSFTIPYSIGGMDLGHPLCYLRASINLMSLSIFKKLGIGKAQQTKIVLQLANRFIVRLEGM